MASRLARNVPFRFFVIVDDDADGLSMRVKSLHHALGGDFDGRIRQSLIVRHGENLVLG